MFNSISWAGYFEFMLVVLLPYYATILVIYYRKDIQLKVMQLQNPEAKQIPVASVDIARQENKAAIDDNTALFSSVHDLMEELKIVFQHAHHKKFPKEELLTAVQVKLQQYPQLKGTAFQVAINNHLIQQAAAECNIQLEENEAKTCW